MNNIKILSILIILCGCGGRQYKEVDKKEDAIMRIFIARIASADQKPTRVNLEQMVLGIKSALSSEIQKTKNEVTTGLNAKVIILADRISKADPTLSDNELIQFIKSVGMLGIDGSPDKVLANTRDISNMNDSWLDDFIDNARDIHSKGIANRALTAQDEQLIKQMSFQLITFTLMNRYTILQIGQDTYKEVVLMLTKGQTVDAWQLFYNKLSTVDLVNNYQENANIMLQLLAQQKAFNAFWISAAEQLGGGVLTIIAKALVPAAP